MRRWLFVLLLSSTSTWAAEPQTLFQERVAPLLERRCVGCHHTGDAKGRLALDTATGLLRGGEQGPVIVPRRPEASLLLDYVTGEAPEMPKSGPPLTADEVQTLKTWIAAGAPWPQDVTLRERPAADLNWWSLHPLRPVSIPAVTDPDWCRNPIDRFLLAELDRQGLTPSPAADRRTLIRRLTYDLWGLPPTPEQIAEFLDDPRPDAYERLVDRLLASPLYGERWARHWLDVVHFGETHGYDKDKPRPHAWPYRDYVIRSFNADKPYALFVKEQLAGDVVAPHTVDGVTALGFIAAGPWDYIGHAEVPESKTDGKIARNLDRDDMVVTTLNTFCSVTVQCARCHAHKFDPVSQADYYRLQAVFAALDRADRPFDAEPEVGRQRMEWTARQRDVQQQLTTIELQIQQQAGPRLAELNRRLTALAQAKPGELERPTEHGYHSRIETQDMVAKWVQVDLGTPQVITQIVLQPCYDDYKQIGAGFGFPPRFRIEVANDAEFREPLACVVDRTAVDLPNPGITRQAFPIDTVTARYVRVTATKLASRQGDFIFALSELEVLDPDGKNLADGRTVTALDSIEAPPRWQRSNLVDGRYPRSREATTDTEREQLTRERQQLLADKVAAELLTQQRQLTGQLAEIQTQLQQLPPPQQVYAGTIHHGSGAFRGTGPDGGRPRAIHVLHRGDVNQTGDRVQPGVPPFLPNWPTEFPLPEPGTEAAARLALAEWIVDQRHPLTWRSIVNRVWQYHFGQGLVDSPNDFGRMGQLPSHPELLDWLAIEFRDGGQSLKRLHRSIVTSAAYRQVSADRPEAAAIDAGNRFLWRAARRKLDAEAVRDSLLFVSGRLNLQMGGPSFQDFVIERPQHSPTYEYRRHDPEDPRAHRRSVYRFLVRSQPQPFMSVLDCADPSMSVDKRNESINPLQALALLNNGLTLVAARDFAQRLEAETPPDAKTGTAPERRLSQLLTSASERALGRPPTAEELDLLVPYAHEHGLANACRVLLNLNEFAFVD